MPIVVNANSVDVGLADDDGAGLPQAPDDDGIGGSWRGGVQDRRTGGRGFARDVEVFDRNDRPIERTKRAASLAANIGSVSRRARCIGVQFQEHALPGTRSQACQDLVETVAGRNHAIH